MATKSAPPRSKPKSTQGRTTKKKKAPPGKGAESRAFRRSWKRAEKTVQDPKQTAKLVAQARKKLSETWDRLEDAVDELEALIRMIQAYAKGDYRDVPWTTIVAATGAVIYFVMPLDLIPDPLPVVGYSDDVTVVLFVLATIQHEVDAFQRWEQKHSRGPSASRVSRKPRPTKSSGSATRRSPAAKRSTA